MGDHVTIRNAQGRTLYRHPHEGTTGPALVLAIEAAYTLGYSFRGADLRDANLSRLRGCAIDLREADLRGACLRDAVIPRAFLTDANLAHADLTGAELRGANLKGANLTRTRLDGAACADVILDTPSETHALATADYDLTRLDLEELLGHETVRAPHVERVILSLKRGTFDGTSYYGECRCLVGGLQHAIDQVAERDAWVPRLPERPRRLIERFATPILPDDTPATSGFARELVRWLEAWTESDLAKAREARL